MSKSQEETANAGAGAGSIAQAASAAARTGPPPVHLWNPPFCGDLDMRVDREGRWHYQGTPIGREPLVRLFASVLRRDVDLRYYLVTPVEKVGIVVEDAPFIAVDLDVEGDGAARRIRFSTNVGDETVLGPERPLRVIEDAGGAPRPYVLVRGRLEARLDRKTFYRLVDVAEVEPESGRFGVWSEGAFFPLEPNAST